MKMLTLNNGVQMPAQGFGVFQSAPEETVDAVLHALKVGYRHIDTAAAYLNEREVGQAIAQSGIPREEIFVETKVWITDYGYEETLHAFEKASAKLGLDYIDLFILHQPATNTFDATFEAYRALEELYSQGKVRAIGVSNFQDSDLDRLLEVAKVVPAVNQVEYHPYFHGAHERDGILVQAWSPIGGITFYPGWGEDRRSTLTDPTIGKIAQAHGKTPAQVMLRWHLQEGRSAIPKSVKPHRIEENFAINDFELSVEELAEIDALDTGHRNGPEPAAMDKNNNNFVIPEA